MLSNLTLLSQISWLKMLKNLQLEYMYFEGDIKVEEGERKKKEGNDSISREDRGVFQMTHNACLKVDGIIKSVEMGKKKELKELILKDCQEK